MYRKLVGKAAFSLSLFLPRLPLYLASLFISLVFLLVNLTCAVLVKTGTWERKAIVSVRVAINDTLFVLCAVSLSICLYKISKMSLANIYLESKVRRTRGWDPAIRLFLERVFWDFPGSPLVMIWHSWCRGHRFLSRVGELRSHILYSEAHLHQKKFPGLQQKTEINQCLSHLTSCKWLAVVLLPRHRAV